MMKSYKTLIFVFLVFGLLGMIRGLDPVTPGQEYMMHINAVNKLAEDTNDVSVSVYIYDLGLYFKTNEFNIDSKDSDSKIVLWDVPNYISSGEYLARITASNDDYRTVKHRIITVA